MQELIYFMVNTIKKKKDRVCPIFGFGIFFFNFSTDGPRKRIFDILFSSLLQRFGLHRFWILAIIQTSNFLNSLGFQKL